MAPLRPFYRARAGRFPHAEPLPVRLERRSCEASYLCADLQAWRPSLANTAFWHLPARPLHLASDRRPERPAARREDDAIPQRPREFSRGATTRRDFLGIVLESLCE